jgi:Cu/Ag efflux protein CusF
MKKAIAIVLSLVLMFAFTAVTFAAEKAAAPAEKKEAAPAKKVAKKQVTGEVAAVDAKANTLTVKGKKGDVTVSTDDKTTVVAGKVKKTLADVKAGDKVSVKYTEADGKNTATKVSIMAAPAKKAEKKAVTPEKKEAAPVAAPAPAPAAPAKKKAAGY